MKGQKKPKVRDVDFSLVDNKFRLSLVTTKGKQEPFLITDSANEALAEYLYKIGKYGVRRNFKIVSIINQQL
jgi:hypothetical protein